MKTINEINNITVLGSGLMGRQIALVCAKYGYNTRLFVFKEEENEELDKWIEEYLSGRVKKGKISAEEQLEWRGRLTCTNDLRTAVSDTDMVIESLLENIDIKREWFEKIDAMTNSECILVSNSSAIPSSNFTENVKKRGNCANLHFFNPALVMELVEIVLSEFADPKLGTLLSEFALSINKTPIILKKEVEGFVVTKILSAISEVAFELVDGGYITPQEFDIAEEKGLSHPMGYFRLMDLTGIDLTYFGKKTKYEAMGKKLPEFFVKQFESGNYGRKTGKGWYDYADK